MQPRSQSPDAALADDCRTWVFRRESEGLWLRWNVQRRIRPGYARARTRRLRPAKFCFRSIRAGDVPDLHFRVRRTKGEVAASTGFRKSDRLFRPDGATIRLESRRYAHTSGAQRR